jgi:NAD(P)-dependent dehydrogenase (short-subunit alcohol dehydrogenase family)
VNVAPYAASKGGVEAFTRVLALEAASAGVRVNAVAPGSVDTPMLWSNPLVESGVEQVGPNVGQPDDIAAAILFLASKESRFINGTTLMADGGRINSLTEGAP